jgi:hypothetical protein
LIVLALALLVCLLNLNLLRLLCLLNELFAILLRLIIDNLKALVSILFRQSAKSDTISPAAAVVVAAAAAVDYSYYHDSAPSAVADEE